MEAAAFLAEVGEQGLDLGAHPYIAELGREAVNNDREQHVAGSLMRAVLGGIFGVGAKPFAEFLADGGEAVKSHIFEKFHGDVVVGW